MATLSAPKEYIVEIDIAKVAAALRIKLGRELGFYKVVLEGDVFQVVQALNKDSRNWC